MIDALAWVCIGLVVLAVASAVVGVVMWATGSGKAFRWGDRDERMFREWAERARR